MAANEQNLCMGCMAPLDNGGVCSVCGFDEANRTEDLNVLQPRSLLAGRYIIGNVASTDCEGVFYVGYDRMEEKRVWIREYAPPNISSRNYSDFSVQPFPSAGAQYKALLSDFDDMCSSVMKASASEKVIPILDMVWENNTAYAVYRYVKTITLENFLSRSGGKLSWRHTKKLLMPLLHTVSNVHKLGLIHRGLTPDSVLLDQSGDLWLSGFMIAAARTNKSELSGLMSAGYSAPEQYSLNSWQGVWTDVYALGAIMYRTVTGKEPPDARDRVFGDDLLSESNAGPDLAPNVIDAINHALRVEVEERTQSAEIFVTELLSTEGSNTAVYAAPVRRKPLEYEEADTAADDAAKSASVPGKASRAASGKTSAASGKKRPASPRKTGAERKKARPVLSLVLSMVVGVVLLGGVVFWLANDYLSDLFFPSSASSQAGDFGTGSEFSAGNMEDDRVPSLTGTTATSVKDNPVLNRRYDLVFEEGFNDAYAEGVIYNQSPPAGSSVSGVSHITLFVSKGPETVEMPDVIDLPADEARELLDALEVSYDIFEVFDRSLKPGVISSCNKQAGTMINKNKDIIILYMRGGDAEIDPDDSDAMAIDSQSDKKPSSSRPGGIPTGVYFTTSSEKDDR